MGEGIYQTRSVETTLNRVADIINRESDDSKHSEDCIERAVKTATGFDFSQYDKFHPVVFEIPIYIGKYYCRNLSNAKQRVAYRYGQLQRPYPAQRNGDARV